MARYYKINEFAEAVGVSASTLREYEKRGWLVPHHKTPSGYRIYSEEQVKKFLQGEYSKREEDFS